MDFKEYSRIDTALKAALNNERYIHTLGVAYTSSALAMRYGYDTDKALMAGLLHDCAKCFPTEEKFRLCEEGKVCLSESEIRNPALIHAKLGAYIAVRDYGINEPEILDAIRTHTTGSPSMSLLQKIVYIADLIEPNRDDIIAGIEIMRQLSFTDIDMAVYTISKRQLEYLASQPGKEIDPGTRETFEYYKEVINGR